MKRVGREEPEAHAGPPVAGVMAAKSQLSGARSVAITQWPMAAPTCAPGGSVPSRWYLDRAHPPSIAVMPWGFPTYQ
jgi:hypothetical protein